ncbi:MAG: transposase [Rhizobiales bacterium]|nr:transposase [Hyphomicrobiales bacterium]
MANWLSSRLSNRSPIPPPSPPCPRRLGRLRQEAVRRPAQVLAYPSLCTHRVAIANSRRAACDQTHVARCWGDYRQNSGNKVARLKPDEFIRRLPLHTLPDGFHRIRSFGFMANGHGRAMLALCRPRLAEEGGQAAQHIPAPSPDYTSRPAIDAVPLARSAGGSMRRALPQHHTDATHHETGHADRHPKRHLGFSLAPHRA